MKCRKFVRVKDIIKGNAKLNLAFLCNLFNNFPALEPAEEELPNLEETREEKTFRNWMNSMGVKPFVHNLFLDLDDGSVLLQLFDLVKYKQFSGGVQLQKTTQIFETIILLTDHQ